MKPFTGTSDKKILKKDETHDVSIIFQPKSSGMKSTDLIIESNDFKQPKYSIKLNGVATKPANFELEVLPSKVEFKNVMKGKTVEKIITIKNKGNVNIKIGNIITSGTH